MPMPIFLSLEGNNQGKIEGSCNIAGHENKILVQELMHDVSIPRSPQTGLPTGKRVHGPITITKEIDKGSPKLMQALCSGEQMKSVLLEFIRISPKGMEEIYYTIKLENAIIVSVNDYSPMALLKENDPMRHMEKVSFTYEKIIWTWVTDGIEAEDSWTAPKA